MGINVIQRDLRPRDLWPAKDESNELIKAALTYAEKTGSSDYFLTDESTYMDDTSIEEILSDEDMELEMKLLYKEECLDNFFETPYFNEDDWDDDEKYNGNKSYEEFLDMIKNNLKKEVQ